jgi:hypothetical protein
MPIELGSFSLGSTVGGVIGVVLGHFLTKSRAAEERGIKYFNDTAAIFREAFIVELEEMKNPVPGATTDPHSILLAGFEKHRTAVHLFRFSLSKVRQDQFDRAWHNYYAYDDTLEESAEYLIKYSPGWEQKPIQECRETAINNIEKLLEFAKHK